jgi:hypothetical protein
MPVDYDAPRRDTTDETGDESLQTLTVTRDDDKATVDVDEDDAAESFELPGADLSDEELTVRVVPIQRDEFTCSSCFLVHHRSHLASERGGQPICSECA